MRPSIVLLALLIACSVSTPLNCAAASADDSIAAAQVLPTQGSADNRSAENLVKASVQSGSTADAQINRAINSIGRRNGIIWADYAGNQTWAACPNWGTQSITLVLYPVMYTIAANCMIPPNVSLQFSHGSCLAPADGTTTTVTGYFTAPMSEIFCNATAGHGTIKLATDAGDGGQSLVHVYPEWWGASGNAPAAINTPALQAAIVGAYGNDRRNGSPPTRSNRILHFSSRVASASVWEVQAAREAT